MSCELKYNMNKEGIILLKKEGKFDKKKKAEHNSNRRVEP
jgi:hypothetical protein